MFKGLFGNRAPVMCDLTEGLDGVDAAVDAVRTDNLAGLAPRLAEMTPDDRSQWVLALSQSLPPEMPLPEPSSEPDPDRDAVLGPLLAAWVLRTVDLPRTKDVTRMGEEIEAYLGKIAERAMGALIRADSGAPGQPDLWGWRLLCANVLGADPSEMEDLADGLEACDTPSLTATHLRMMTLRRRSGGSQAAMWRYVKAQTAMPPSAGWLGLTARAHLEDIAWYLHHDPDKTVRKRYREEIKSAGFRGDIVALNQKFLDRVAAEGPSHRSAQRYGRNMLASLMTQMGESGHLVPHLTEIGDKPMHLCWGGAIRLKDLNSVRNLAMMPPIRPD